MTYELTELQDRHKLIKRLLFLGYKNKEISEVMGISEGFVSQVKNSQIMQRELAELHARADDEVLDIQQELQLDAVGSVTLLRGIRDGLVPGADVKLRASVARDLLDRAGFSKVTKVQSSHSHFLFTPDDIKDMKESMNAELSAMENTMEAELVDG